MPIKGTRARRINEIKKKIIENLRSWSLSIEDRKKITITPRRMKTKCLKKKE